VRCECTGTGRALAGAAPLAMLGPGSLLGQNVLGYDPEQVCIIIRQLQLQFQVIARERDT